MMTDEELKRFRANCHLVIMAGGIGSRFWPASSEERPKQFLDVLGCGKTLIQLTIERFANLINPENIWVATSAAYKDLVEEQLPQVPKDQILFEPVGRNTAPCIAYVSWKIKKVNPRANVAVTPSDHVVLNVPEFEKVVFESMEFAAETDSIVTLGIKPNRPETGYGYIEADLSYSSSRLKNIFRVDSFREKPALDLAKQYVSQNNFFWNSGIFIWRVSTIVNAFRVYSPQISAIFESLLPYYGTDKEQELINEKYPTCENISVDYAIMEKAEEIFVCPADFGWSDLGSWSSLAQQLRKDQYNNVCIGPNIGVFDTHNCIIRTIEEKQVIIQGLDGYVVAETEDKLLICKLSDEQRIKTFVEQSSKKTKA